MMQVYNNLINRKTKLSVVGLGYTGLPISLTFAQKINVIGYDIQKKKIEKYKQKQSDKYSIDFTCDPLKLCQAQFHIIAVPTPIFADNTPNLTMIKDASKIVGQNLCKGSIIVYESTVYPGVTEDICIPILEKNSGLKCGLDFFVGYCPERINVGDQEHEFTKIVKVVSGNNQKTTNEIAKIYGLVVKAGIYKAPSIKVAEAAKVLENCQRDINIAFMNEAAMIFNKLGIDTKEVLEAAGTKWNFLPFSPGLVGGHCVSVDPYYLIYKAQLNNYQSSLISTGRKINNSMGEYIAKQCIKQLNKAEIDITNAQVAILGCTFKENCDDVRNSKVFDIIKKLNEYGIKPIVVDPKAKKEEVKEQYNIKLENINQVKNMDVIILAVAHSEYCQFSIREMDKFYGSFFKILLDIKGIYNKAEFEKAGYSYWRL